jgi:membrane-associated phospholipid phosphatase
MQFTIQRPAREPDGRSAEATASSRRSLLREVLFVVTGYVIYSQVRGLAGGRDTDALANGHHIVNIEEKLGIFRELSLQTFILGHGLIDAFNVVYFYGFFPLILITAAWLYMKRPAIYAQARNAFLLSGGIAVCFFLTLPTAPPRLMSLGFVDTLGRDLTMSYSSMPGVNHYAALPSMHVGWSFLAAFALYSALEGVRFRAVFFLLPVVMFLSTVVTGNHYFLDGLLGIFVAGAALLIAREIGRRQPRGLRWLTLREKEH